MCIAKFQQLQNPSAARWVLNIPAKVLLGNYQVRSEEADDFEDDNKNQEVIGDDISKEPAYFSLEKENVSKLLWWRCHEAT